MAKKTLTRYIEISKNPFPGSKERVIEGQIYHINSRGYSSDDEVMQAAEKILANRDRDSSLKTNKLEIKSW